MYASGMHCVWLIGLCDMMSEVSTESIGIIVQHDVWSVLRKFWHYCATWCLKCLKKVLVFLHYLSLVKSAKVTHQQRTEKYMADPPENFLLIVAVVVAQAQAIFFLKSWYILIVKFCKICNLRQVDHKNFENCLAFSMSISYMASHEYCHE